MTTPAHCTRTWTSARESYHHVQHICVCGNVEPPADVQATPDPRLDVVAKLVHDGWDDPCDCTEPEPTDVQVARRILDALDDLAGAQTTHEPDPGQDAAIYREGWQAGYRTSTTDYDRFAVRPTPTGLTPAQEIRLRIAETLVEIPMAVDVQSMLGPLLSPLAAWVEHGDDETPDPDPPRRRQLVGELREANARAKAAEARAVLAEARLGHIRHVSKKGITDAEFRDAALAALAWTPDDTATVQHVTENDDGVWHYTDPASADAQCPRDSRCTDSPGHAGHCPTGAATGDGDG